MAEGFSLPRLKGELFSMKLKLSRRWKIQRNSKRSGWDRQTLWMDLGGWLGASTIAKELKEG